MAKTIAFAGKGGTGKTTICGLLIDYLCKTNQGPILAVDADANANLNEVLGVDIKKTLGEIREIIAHSEVDDTNPIPIGMSKQDFAEFQFNSALLEMDDYDMLVMGRTQGQGCYCYVNGVLKTQIDKYSKNYQYVVVDNEAGLEHISRGVLPSMDILLLVSDCSRRGIQAAGRLRAMVDELGLSPSAVKLIVNRAPSTELDPGVLEEIGLQQLDLIGVVPADDVVYRYDAEGRPTISIPDDNPVKQAVYQIIRELALQANE
jgi:CO dehydrogenase maturation factor